MIRNCLVGLGRGQRNCVVLKGIKFGTVPAFHHGKVVVMVVGVKLGMVFWFGDGGVSRISRRHVEA